MRHFLDRTRFVAYPLLVSFFLLSVDAATFAFASQSEAHAARPRGREEAKPHHLVERSRIFLERAEEASRKLGSRLPLPGKLEAAELFRKELDQFRSHLREQLSDESENLGRRRMPEEARERFRLLDSRIDGVLAEIDGAFERVERGLEGAPGSREARDLEEALRRFHKVTEEVAVQDRRPVTFEELPHWAPERAAPELPEPAEPHREVYRPPSPLKKALSVLVSFWSQSVALRASFAPGFPLRTTPAAAPAAAPLQSGGGVAPPSSSDLAETPETPFTEQIRELAGRLASPVRMYEFVRNNVDTELYHGSLKGAEETLFELAGNDIDQASLLVALLRASGVPARYVQGIIEVPREDLASWLRIDDAERAADALQRAGIPADVATDSRGVSGVRLQYTWVRAYVEYASDVGNRFGEPTGRRGASSWVDLAPAFKAYDFSPGRDVAAEIGVDPASFLADIKSQARVDEAAAFATDVPEPLILDRIEEWSGFTRAYAEANDRTVDTLFLDREIVPKELGALPGALPFEVEPGTTELAAIPVSFSYELEFELMGAAGVHFSHRIRPSEIAGKRIVLSYSPSTSADEATLQAHLAEEEFPVYLMRVTPELRFDAEVVASGQSTGMGAIDTLRVSVRGPGISYSNRQAVVAGEILALVFDLQRTSTERLHNRLSRLRTAERTATEREAILGEALSAIGTSYFHELDALNHLTAGSLQCLLTREPSFVTVKAALELQGLLGVPFLARADRVSLRLNADVLRPFSLDGDRVKERQFLVASSLSASALQHAALEESLGSRATSALRVIQQGNNESRPIHTLDPSNADAILATLSFLPEGAKDAIRNAVASGRQVTVPAEPVPSGGVSRVGFGVLDPETGASAFNIYPEGPVGLGLLATPFRPAVYLQDEPANVYAPVTGPLLNWLNQAEEVFELVQFSFVPAASSIAFWFRDTSVPDKVTTIASVIAISSPIDRIGGRPNLTRAQVSPSAFSPDGNSVQDLAQISAGISRESDWTVEIQRESTLHRTFTGQGLAIDLSWDGRDESGAELPDGFYDVVLNATDVSTGLQAIPLRLRVRLDRTAPTAEILSPADGSPVGGFVSVIGTADDTALRSYTLEVGKGGTPSSFTKIETGSTPVINASLGIWNTESGDDGIYTLRLTARDDAGNVSVATRTADVLNPGRDAVAPQVSIVTPQNGASLSGLVPLSVQATDNVGVARVELLVDSALEKVFATPPFTHTLRSEKLSNGAHRITARALDAKGNEGTASVDFTTANAISEYRARPETLTPNGDGLDDETVLSARLEGAQSWTLTLRDAVSGVAVRTFTGTSELLSVAWNGSDDGGTLVPDANYVARLETATAVAELNVLVESVDRPPTVEITYPQHEDRLTGVVDVLGTATDTAFQSYTLEFKHMKASEWKLLTTSDQPVVNGVLGKLDTTLLQNDPYELRLSASDGSQIGSTTITVYPSGELKIGNFELSFTDLEVPVSGIPVAITRTYRSLDKTKGDFGIGWNLSFAATYTIDPDFNVTLNLPDGRRATFFIGIDPSNSQNFQRLREVPYTPEPGVYDKFHWDVVDFITGQERFTLETKSGDRYNYAFDELRSVQTRNGNTLTFAASGITHQSGAGVSFERDLEGRIQAVVDPKSNRVEYSYDGKGDLVSVKDAEDNVTTLSYNDNHDLLDIDDPEGRTPLRTDYDAEGRLILATDRRGNSDKIQHDPVARRALVTDRNAGRSVYEYDSRGLVTTIVDALGGRRTFEYDEKKNLTAEVDALGNRTEYAYDSRGNRTSETRVVDGKPLTTFFTYDAANNLTSTTDALTRKTANVYDASGNLTSTMDAQGNVTKFEYDGSGNIIRQTNPDGSTVESTYDGSGRELTETVVVGGVSRTTRFTYDLAGNVETEEDPRQNVTRTVYDGNGRITEVHDPLGNVRRTSFFPAGELRSETDEASQTTSYVYRDVNGQGLLVQISRPDGTAVFRGEDKAGNVVFEEIRKPGEPNDHVTTRTYDAKNQLTKITYPDGSSTTNEYDRAGRLVATLDERHNRTEFSYDEMGRRTSVRNPLGETTRFEYDDSGNQTAVIDPKLSRTEFRYDALNRLVKTVFPDGTVQSTAYDALGRKLSETDPANRTNRFAYDEAGQLISVTDALGNVTKYEYDPSGNRTAIIDANDHRTEFEYDERNLLEKKTWPDGKFETYTYNSQGLLESKTDPKSQTIQFLYDEMGRLMEKSYPDGTFVRFTYTRTGERETVEDSRGITRYRYDLRDRMTEILYPDGRKLTFAYDPAGNRESLTAHVGNQILTTTYTYDRANRLDTVTDPNGKVTRYGYDSNGNRASLAYPNGTATSYEYDDLNRLTQVVTSGPSGVIQSYDYVLGPTGNRQRIDEADGTVREYGYDSLYRLTRETITTTLGPVYEKSFVYDPVGNRLNQTTTGEGAAVTEYTYDNRDRLLTENSTAYGWDDNGNLISKSGEATYFWDFENRLVQVEKTDGTVVTHAYDADGNRVRTEVTPLTGPPQITQFLVDTSGSLSHVVAETDGSGTLLALYVRGDDLQSVVRTTEHRFYHADGLGSIRYLTDGSGVLSDTYSYAAFGQTLTRIGSDEQPYQFAGESYESETDFYYNRSRWLDVGLARFASMDEFAGIDFVPMTFHKFLYANNNPVLMTDPSGLLSEQALTAIGIGVTLTIAAVAAARVAIAIHNRFLSDKPITIRTQPIIVDGSGWTQSEALAALIEAGNIWNDVARINVVWPAQQPIPVVQNTNLLGVTANSTIPMSNFPPQWGKHMTIFTDVVMGLTPGDAGGAWATGGGRTANFLAFGESGFVLAHEWGHALIGHGHTGYPSLMGSGNVNSLRVRFLSESQRKDARATARKNPPWLP
jgi:RHS repeat-associated protein